MKCPVDGATLQMSERQGVEIDYCPDCRGVWLDRGELDKIITRSDDDVDGRDDDRDRDRYQKEREHRPDSGHYNKPKKKKSFFSEIMEGFGGAD